MKRWISIFFLIFLVACHDHVSTTNTPEEALELLHTEEGYAKVVGLLNSLSISEEQIFYVFEGELNEEKEWFVAHLEKDRESNWVVQEAINIGLPHDNVEDYTSGTNTFTAGIGNRTETIKESWKVIPITDDVYVWIEMK